MAEGRTALRVGRLFDGTGRPVQPDVYVVVEGERIASVEKERPELGLGTRLIEAPDGTLLPGLIDCHVHFTLSGSPRWLDESNDPVPLTAWKAAGFARQTLEAGFTTVRTLGGRASIEIHLRDAIASGLLSGPRIRAAGYAICMTGGHGWWMGREADGPHEVRKAAREQLRAGADVVKFIATGGVMTPGVEPGAAQLGFGELRAGIEEAHKAGKLAAAHAQGAEGIRNALEAGVDSIEHGFYLYRDEALVGLMKERGTYLVPTMVAAERMARAGTEGGVPEWAVRKAIEGWEASQRTFAAVVSSGVSVAFGTDAGTPFNYHGNNALELELMVKGGMSAEQALIAATQHAARLLRLEHELGTVEPGKLADLVLVDGDPLADISLLQRPEKILGVFKGGKLEVSSLGVGH